MGNMDLVLKKVKELADREPKSITQLGLKMCEEVGEAAQAVLSYTSASGSTYKVKGREDVAEECVDTILVALSLIYNLGGYNSDDIEEMMEKKMKKWEKKMTPEQKCPYK